MTRRIATRARRLAMTLALIVAGGLGLVGVARAAPVPGLYEGHTAAGITVAVTVIGQGPTAQVTDTGAICQSPNPGPVGAPSVDGVGADGEYRYRIADDGAFGAVGAGDDQEVAGQINGTSGEVSVSRNSLLMRFCDPADDADHAPGDGYAVPVTPGWAPPVPTSPTGSGAARIRRARGPSRCGAAARSSASSPPTPTSVRAPRCSAR